MTLEALKLTRNKICGSSTVGVANGIQLQNYSKHLVWKSSRGRCVKYRLEGQSCIPTLSSPGRFASSCGELKVLPKRGHHGTAACLCTWSCLHGTRLRCSAFHLRQRAAPRRVLCWAPVGQLPLPTHLHAITGNEHRVGAGVLTD